MAIPVRALLRLPTVNRCLGLVLEKCLSMSTVLEQKVALVYVEG